MLNMRSVSAIVGFINSEDSGLIIIDANSNIIFLTRKASKILGGSYNKLIGTNLNEYIGGTQSHPHKQNLNNLVPENVTHFKKQGVVKAKNLEGNSINVNVSKRKRFKIGSEMYYSAIIEAA